MRLTSLLIFFAITAEAAPAPKVVSVGLGLDHSCAVFDSGQVKCWGGNASGQLGLENTNSRGDSPGTMGSALPYVNLGTGVSAVAVGSGDQFSCALIKDGTVKCWGKNGLGELGQGDTKNRGQAQGTMGNNLKAVNLGTGRKVVSLAVGYDSTCAILDNHDLKCWGANDAGNLGLGDQTPRGSAAGQMGDQLKPVNLGTGRYAIQIGVGYRHACALLDDLSVKCWGRNDEGELGKGDTTSVGGSPGQMGDALPTIDLGTTLKPIELAVGSYHTCVLFVDSSVKCWGYGGEGALGQGDSDDRGDQPSQLGANLPFVVVEPGLPVASLSCRAHCCAQFAGVGTLKCWGYNGEGEAGQGDTTFYGRDPGQMGVNLPFVNLGDFEAVQAVFTGDPSTCAVLSDGALKCWGFGGDGELGLGDTTNRGVDPSQMGSALPRLSLY